VLSLQGLPACSSSYVCIWKFPCWSPVKKSVRRHERIVISDARVVFKTAKFQELPSIRDSFSPQIRTLYRKSPHVYG
jgi:hypothetical protein